jgi:hypothetical protein
MLRWRFTTDCHGAHEERPRAPEHHRRGQARARPQLCRCAGRRWPSGSPGIIAPMARAKSGTVSAALTRSVAACRRARGRRPPSATGVRGSSAMPQIGQLPGPGARSRGASGRSRSRRRRRARWPRAVRGPDSVQARIRTAPSIWLSKSGRCARHARCGGLPRGRSTCHTPGRLRGLPPTVELADARARAGPRCAPGIAGLRGAVGRTKRGPPPPI